MIKVVIKRHQENITSIEVKGHANSGPHGYDLVCAAVSAIMVGAANALDDKKRFDIQIKEGYVLIERITEDSDNNETLNTVITMLKTVEESNSQFIRIEEKDN